MFYFLLLKLERGDSNLWKEPYTSFDFHHAGSVNFKAPGYQKVTDILLDFNFQ